MNPARIGDTVHYVPQLSPDKACCAAIVTALNEDASEITVRVLDPRSINDYAVYPMPDPGNGWEDFTPGTWHHIH